MKSFLLGLGMVFVSTQAWAAPITASFSGIVQACPMGILCNRFGLNIENDTPVTGTLSYDPDTDTGVSLTAHFSVIDLTSNEFILQRTPTRFNLNGRILLPSGGFFLNITLARATPGPLPTSLSCADWDVCAFVLWPFEGAPSLPLDSPAIAAINLNNGEPTHFTIITDSPRTAVPEPGTFGLLGIGGVSLWAAYRHHRR